jgi:hypothetical protein
MNTASRQGLGFEYEDKIRTSAIIHMYSNMHFLDLESHITVITLGGAKYGYKTDDIIIETHEKKYCIQVKKTINGISDDSFDDFLKNAYVDFLKDQTSYYCLVTEVISKDFFNSLKNLLNSVNGVSNSNEFDNIIITKKEIALKNDLIKKIKNSDIYLFLRQIKIFQINSDESFNKDKIILNQFKVADLKTSYNTFFFKVKELKENNQTINKDNFHDFFNFLDYKKNTTINKEWKNNIIDYIYKINELTKKSYNYEDYHKFFVMTKSILCRLQNEDSTILNSSINRSTKILEVIMKYSLAVASDLRVLSELFIQPCPEIKRLNMFYNYVDSEIINNLKISDCVFNIINEDFQNIEDHYAFIAGRRIYKFKLENNILNLLISKSSNFYSNDIFNYEYYTIELMNLLSLTINGTNVIDTIGYLVTLDKLSESDYKIFTDVFDKDSINMTLAIIENTKLYENKQIPELMRLLRSINLIFIMFMNCCNKHKNLGIPNEIIGSLHFLGDQFNKIDSKDKQKHFLKYLDFCQVNDINNEDILYFRNIFSFLNVIENNEDAFDEKKIISFIFTQEKNNNKWYQVNQDILNNLSTTRFPSWLMSISDEDL